jgi:hypothetical protein
MNRNKAKYYQYNGSGSGRINIPITLARDLGFTNKDDLNISIKNISGTKGLFLFKEGEVGELERLTEIAMKEIAKRYDPPDNKEIFYDAIWSVFINKPHRCTHDTIYKLFDYINMKNYVEIVIRNDVKFFKLNVEGIEFLSKIGNYLRS